MRRRIRVGSTQQLLLHDTRTGVTRQLEEAHTVHTGYSKYVGVWFMCTGNELVDAFKEHDITAYKALALSLHLYTVAEIGTNKVRLTLTEMAAYISADLAYTSRLLKDLVRAGICRKIQNGLYCMNPTYGWRGTAVQAEKMKKEWESAL